MYRESILVCQLLHKLPSTWRGQLPLLRRFFLAATLLNFGLFPGRGPTRPQKKKLTLNCQLESYLIK